MTERILPHDIGTEESVLAACLEDEKSLIQTLDALVPTDFYRTKHQKLFRAFRDLSKAETPVNIHTVTDILQKRKELSEVKASFIADLITNVPPRYNLHYAKMIKDKSLLREMIAKAREVEQECYNCDNVPKALDNAQTKFMGISYGGFDDKFIHLSDGIDTQYNHWEKISKSPGITGIPTGLDIDLITGGFQKTDLIILAARPAMGKTALALNIACNVARKGLRVGIFSLEMSSPQLINRMVASESRVDSRRFQTGELKDHWQAVSSHSATMSEWPMFIDDTPGLSYMEIRRRSRQLKKKSGVDLIIIDYLQLAAGDRSDGRTREVGSISRNMKHMAKELNVPVLLLSQLSRSLESRPKKRPILSDLRDSGEIEQDADVVMFIYRSDVYWDKNKGVNPEIGVAEIAISKHRNGPTGMKKLSFLAAYTRFENRVLYGE